MKTQLPNSMVLKRLPSALRFCKTCRTKRPTRYGAEPTQAFESAFPALSVQR
jgi:hypothetical protein